MSVSAPAARRAAPVDPELYLRRQGERSLAAARQAPHESPLGPIASALVAVGVLEDDLARAIVHDYALARELRPGAQAFPFMHRADPAPVTQPDTPVVALLFDEDPQADGSLPYAVLTSECAEIAVTYRGTADWSVVAKRYPNPGPSFPQSMPLADDTGLTQPSMFNGGNGNGEWIGRFATTSPLSLTTRWLELGGRRFTLIPPKANVDARVEDLPVTSRAAAFLLHRQASGDHLPPPEGDQVIDALVATGALDERDAILDELSQVWHAGPAVTGQVPPAVRRAMLQQFGGVPPMATPSLQGTGQLPYPWSKYDPQRTVSGPTGVVPIGVATPVVEGAAAVLYALTSDRGGFTVDTEQYGSGTAGRHFAAFAVDPTPGFAWWAEDDLGNLYRGSWGSWSGSGNGRRGHVSYAPALDPKAKRLRLLPTLRTHRIVVEIELPDWRPGE